MADVKAMTGVARRGVREVTRAAELLQLRARRAPLSPVRFVIFGRGRTGSSMLVDLLNGLPDVRCDDEVLFSRTLFPREWVRSRCARSNSPVYGCKILSYQVMTVQPIRDRGRFLHRLAADGFQVIHLSRTNLVEHAISNLRAREYGFHQQSSSSETTSTAGGLVVDPTELVEWISRSEEVGRFEAAALDGLPHLALTYEADLVSQAQHGETLRRVCDFLQLPTEQLPPVSSSYQKVSPVALSDSIENYAEVARHLQGTPYARFLS